MKVCKFGGSSLANAAQIRKVCDIVLSDPDRKVVVVSAPGKRNGEDTKMTDMLISLAETSLKNEETGPCLDRITDRFLGLIRELDLDSSLADFVRQYLAHRLAADRSVPDRFRDGLKASGEDLCARIVAEALRRRGADAYYTEPGEAGLLLTDEYGNAQVLEESYANLARLRDKPGILVFPGFFGYTKSGGIVTFPRGGSDITGSILAAGISASVYENFTDVDAVFVANPQMVPHPRPMTEVTYREMRELAYGGFSVLHEETIAPVRQAGIPVHIRNTNNPEAPGTRIVRSRAYTPGEVVGIACGTGFMTLYISKYMMNREIGFGRKLLQIIEEEGISFEHMPSGIDDISLILKESALDPAREHRIIRRIRQELKADRVDAKRDLSLLLVVGEGMQHTVGIAARVTAALAGARVNLDMINQGSSEITLMFGIRSRDAVRAVRALYDEFFGRMNNTAYSTTVPVK